MCGKESYKQPKALTRSKSGQFFVANRVKQNGETKPTYEKGILIGKEDMLPIANCY